MPTLPENLEDVVENAPASPILGEKKDSYEGDFVLQGQELSKTHTHVSRHWEKQCMTIEQGLEVLAEQQTLIQDFKKPLTDWEPKVAEDGVFVMLYKPTGKEYVPTEHALQHIAVTGQGSHWVLKDLTTDKAHRNPDKDDVQFERDSRDAELVVDYVNLLLYQSDRMEQDKVRLWRTWDIPGQERGSLRALLSKDYAVVNNEWFLRMVGKLIPGGLLSHWKGDADTIFGNVLIPDSIRAEEDSDYGGMLSIGNSEIGVRRITSRPSVFRAICMNGCIWDHQLGDKYTSKVHKAKDGKINLDALAAEIKTNLETQIPLIDEGIRLVLASKNLGMGSVPVKNVIGAIVKQYKVGKKVVPKLLDAYRTESAIVGDSAFTVAQAFTRVGQTLSNPLTWVKFDMDAGKIVKMTEKQWKGIISTAEGMTEKQLQDAGVLPK